MSEESKVLPLPEGRLINEGLFEKEAFKADKSGMPGTPQYKVEIAFDPALVEGEGTIEDHFTMQQSKSGGILPARSLSTAILFFPISVEIGWRKLVRRKVSRGMPTKARLLFGLIRSLISLVRMPLVVFKCSMKTLKKLQRLIATRYTRDAMALPV